MARLSWLDIFRGIKKTAKRYLCGVKAGSAVSISLLVLVCAKPHISPCISDLYIHIIIVLAIAIADHLSTLL